MLIYLAQAETQVFTELLKIAGGGTVAAILVLMFWLILTGKIVPRWVHDTSISRLDETVKAERDAKNAERDAKEQQRTRAERAEDREEQLIAVLKQYGEAAEKIVDKTPPSTAGKGSKP